MNTKNKNRESLLGHSWNVLDDGFIKVIDIMGNDSSIVQAARVSYGEGTKKTSENRTLIRYLMRNNHTSPFEMCEIKLHIRVPMDCWRQWIRHRTANVNEYSTRYSIAIDSAQKTDSSKWRIQAESNKQGSNGFLDQDIGQKLSEMEKEIQINCRNLYEDRISKGVAREQARKDLPLSTYTEAFWKIDLHNLLHFLELRMDGHAQYEIRQYANIIGDKIVKEWVPLTWEAFLDFRINSLSLSQPEIEIIYLINSKKNNDVVDFLVHRKWLQYESGRIIKEIGEAKELALKLEKLGLEIPWRH